MRERVARDVHDFPLRARRAHRGRPADRRRAPPELRWDPGRGRVPPGRPGAAARARRDDHGGGDPQPPAARDAATTGGGAAATTGGGGATTARHQRRVDRMRRSAGAGRRRSAPPRGCHDENSSWRASRWPPGWENTLRGQASVCGNGSYGARPGRPGRQRDLHEGHAGPAVQRTDAARRRGAQRRPRSRASATSSPRSRPEEVNERLAAAAARAVRSSPR